jgi:hypothetical protein
VTGKSDKLVIGQPPTCIAIGDNSSASRPFSNRIAS